MNVRHKMIITKAPMFISYSKGKGGKDKPQKPSNPAPKPKPQTDWIDDHSTYGTAF